MSSYSINLTFAQEGDDLCQSVTDPGELLFREFYYWSNTGPLSLVQIYEQDIPIFTDAQYAEDYGIGENPNLVGAADSSFYREFDTLNFYFWQFEEQNSSWIDDLTGQCPSIVEPQVYLFSLYYDPNSSTVSEFCCSGNRIEKEYYYYSDQEYSNLIDLVNDGLLLYVTPEGAEFSIESDLIPFGIYDVSGNADSILEFFTDDIGRPTWFGIDSSGDVTQSPNIEVYYNCQDYIRPTGSTSYLIQSSSSFANKSFYAFWSCTPSSGSFKMHVVDGRHFATDENFMSDFVETLNDNNFHIVSTETEFGCVELKHKIIAESIEKAVELIENNSTDYDSVLESSISDLGISDNVILNIYQTCCDCITNTNAAQYEFGEIGVPVSTGLGPNFNVERNSKLDNIAKPLLRTNPKLTTNVKLVVNSNDNIYLESINATDDLSSVDFKKFSINPKGSYAYDLKRFYNKVPLELAYTTKRKDSDLSVYDEYEKQIEEDYQYGTTLNYSKLYGEEFRIFAPIYVDLNMPKKFVIYRIKDPKPNIDLEDTAVGNAQRIRKLIDNSTIVKVFDLTKKSNIGKYLRNYVKDQAFPNAPITFSFEDNEKTTFNGIDLIKGGFTKKAEYLHSDFILKDKPMIDANNFITDGFRRNSIAAANIINMEFLFDDPGASTYSVNRYIGIYVDDIETGSGDVYTSNRGDIKFKSVNSNMDSIFNYAAIPSYKMLNEMPILAYARTGDNYYRINNTKSYKHSNLEVNVVDPLNKIPNQLGIKYKGESIVSKKNTSAGFDFMKVKVVNTPVYNDRIALINVKKESYRFTFIKFVANVNVEITDNENNTLSFNTGADQSTAIANLEAAYTTTIPFSNIYSLETSMINGKAIFTLTEKESNLLNLSPSVTVSNGCVLNRSEIYTNVEIPDKSYYAADLDPSSPNYLSKGTFKGKYFSIAGDTTDIAIALTKIIKNKGDFDAFNIGSEIYVSVKLPGYKILQHALLVNLNNSVKFLEFENDNIDSENELNLSNIARQNWSPYFFKGGNSVNKSILVSKNTSRVLKIGDYLPTKYNDRYNKVIDIVENIKDIKGDYLKAILSLENSINDNEVRVFADRSLVMGLFSAYSIHDMDFDFHDTSNSNIKELEYETADQIIYAPYDDIKDINTGTNDLSITDIISGDYEIEPNRYFANLQPLLTNETVDDFDLDLISSEYNRLNENEIKEFAIDSRVVPNINKWVLKNGITVREEPYHLNAYSAFGRTNFAPDLEVTERDRRAFTHEWFYIENIPDYLRFWQINDAFSYVNFIKDFELSKTQFKRIDRDYFDMFMVGDGHEIDLYNQDPLSRDTSLFNINSFVKANMHKKYTLIDGGSSETFSSTVFKGLNVVFKKRKEFTNRVASEFVKNAEFNGYKFSIMLKTNNQVNNNSVEYEVIQNKKFKFVIFYITLNINDIWAYGLNRKLLYEIKHQLVFNANTDRYEYADIVTSGALDLKSVSFVGNGPYRIYGISHNDGSEPNFKSQISKNDSGNFNKLQIDLGNIGIYEAKIFSVESDREILIEGIPTKVGGASTDPDYYLDTVGLNIVDLKKATYTYIKGGFGAHELILNEIAAGNVASLLNKNDDQVVYTTVETDGTINHNRFTINFLEGKEIIKKVDLTVTEDLEKPKNYKLSKDTVGYNIVSSNEYFNFMVRHSGDYTIDLEPVVTFTDIYNHFKTNRNHSTLDLFESNFKKPIYKHSLKSSTEIDIAKAYYNKFNRCGVAFNVGFIKDSSQLGITNGERISPQAGIHDSNWGNIKNHYYHKVNEINPNGVLKLTRSEQFLPVYPLIDEIAIDYKDVNVFMSSWENGYYTRSLAGGINVNVSGTFDTAEERSYLGSTAMKLNDVYFLTEFSTQRVSTEEELDDILRTDNNDSNVVFYEDDQILIVDFYMNDIVYKKLSDLGALNTLSKFIDPSKSIGDKTTLSDDMQDYVNKNLVQYFSIDQIDLFVDKFKGSFSNILSTPSIDLLDNDGYTQDRSFTYNMHGDVPLNFRLIYNKRLGYSYDIRPMIKIQS